MILLNLNSSPLHCIAQLLKWTDRLSPCMVTWLLLTPISHSGLPSVSQLVIFPETYRQPVPTPQSSSFLLSRPYLPSGLSPKVISLGKPFSATPGSITSLISFPSYHLAQLVVCVYTCTHIYACMCIYTTYMHIYGQYIHVYMDMCVYVHINMFNVSASRL